MLYKLVNCIVANDFSNKHVPLNRVTGHSYPNTFNYCFFQKIHVCFQDLGFAVVPFPFIATFDCFSNSAQVVLFYETLCSFLYAAVKEGVLVASCDGERFCKYNLL